jgi:hypothetical protein
LAPELLETEGLETHGLRDNVTHPDCASQKMMTPGRIERITRKNEAMAASLNSEILHDLYHRKESFPLEAVITARINKSTLDEATLRFLGMMVICKRPNHIFEFGCGISTMMCARLQRDLGAASSPALVAIDHSHRNLSQTRRSLGSDHDALLIHAPLAVTERSGRVFTTYHSDYARQIPPSTKFDFVIINGPPAFRYGREAPLYHLAQWLSPDALVLLLDACREPGGVAVRNWSKSWPDTFSMELFPNLNKGLAVISIGDATHALPPAIPELQIDADIESLMQPSTRNTATMPVHPVDEWTNP